MNFVDGAVLALLAIADIALLAHMRRLRARRIRQYRMMRSLRLAIEKELSERAFTRKPAARWWALRRAS